MAIITRRITNNLNYAFTIPAPGSNGNQNANLIIPASVINLDLLSLTTEDSLWTLQPLLLSLQNNGDITVTGTFDTAGIDYDGVASLHADSHAELRGDVQLVSGTGVTLSQVGQAITINASGTPITTGNLTDAGTDGIIVTGGTGAVVGSGTSLAQHVADSTHNGYLSSSDWSIFNNKQATGSYITALTGDVTASGPGSSAATIASGAITPSKISTTVTDDFTFPHNFSANGSVHNLGTNGGSPLNFLLRSNSGNQIGITYHSGSGDTWTLLNQIDNTFLLYDGIGSATLLKAKTAQGIEVTALSIGTGLADPNASAILDVTSTTRGAILPRMTNAQRDAISSPAEALLIYSLDDHAYEYWNGSVWKQIATV